MPSAAFFTLHRDLPREGPGMPEDVHWALKVANTPEDAAILDAACGPGADLVTLAQACPRARIDGVDITPHFVEEAKRRTETFADRVAVREGDYLASDASYDLIWCVGAMYFAGFLNVLEAWRPHLKQGGAVAFSEPALVETPPKPDVAAFWDGEGDIRDVPTLKMMLEDAGWQIESHRWIIGEAWQAYYDPQIERIAMLKSKNPDADVATVITRTEREIDLWSRNRDQIAYVLFVVRPA